MMNQWPEDEELSRLYREMPETGSGQRLKERVLAVAREHAAAVRNGLNQPGGAPAAPSAVSPAAWMRGWWIPAGLAASVILSVATFLLVRTSPDTQPVAVAQQDRHAPGVTEAAPPLPPRIRLAEVEPAQRAAGSTGGETETPTPNSRRESDPVTVQASSGFPDQSDEETLKEFPAAKPPKAWLEEIRALRRQGDLNVAKMQLRQFRKTHPDYPLPADVRTLAP